MAGRWFRQRNDIVNPPSPVVDPNDPTPTVTLHTILEQALSYQYLKLQAKQKQHQWFHSEVDCGGGAQGSSHGIAQRQRPSCDRLQCSNRLPDLRCE